MTAEDLTGDTGPGPSTPNGHRLRAWVGTTHGGPTESEAAKAWAQVSGQRPEPMSKRSLAAVSHAIERAVLTSPVTEPTVVVALFQRLEYFDRERDVYARLAATGARVVVGFCDGPQHDLPPGLELLALNPGEALVDEWAVVALNPEAGAFLVATDQHRFDAGAPTLEAGRIFRSRWGFSRVQAAVELARLRLILGNRMAAGTAALIDGLLGAAMPTGADPAGSAGTPQEVWASTAAFHLAGRLHAERTESAQLRSQLTDSHAAAAARYRASTDPQSGLSTPEFLERWSDTGGATTLPIGLGLFELPGVQDAGRDDARAAYHAARRIAAAMTEPLGPVDAAIRLSPHGFLVVLPGASELRLAQVCDDIIDQLALASDGYPHVRLSGGLATTVTRQRPLPLADLRQALELLDPQTAPGPAHAGVTVAGDVITICATRDTALCADAPVPVPSPHPAGSDDGDADDAQAEPIDAEQETHGPNGANRPHGTDSTDSTDGADGTDEPGAAGNGVRPGPGPADGSAVEQLRSLFGRPS